MCSSIITKSVNLCLYGNIIGCRWSKSKFELVKRPPTRRMPDESTKGFKFKILLFVQIGFLSVRVVIYLLKLSL